MTNSVLDMDVTTLGRGLEQAWRWWTGQLAAMVPTRLRRVGVGGAVIAWPEPGGGLRFTRGGHAIMPAAAHGEPAVLALTSGLCLLRTITVPALGKADARRAILLDLDRLLPFQPGQALIGIEVDGAADAFGRPVTLAALPADTAERLLAAADHAGIQLVALALLDEAGTVRFDFLPELRARHGQSDVHAERRFWWRTVIACFALNLVLLVVADVRSVSRFAALVEVHGALADRVRLKRRAVLDEQGWRQAIAARRLRDDPLPSLSDVIAALPATAILKRLELSGGRGRLVGVAPEGTDVSAALRRAPRLAGVHASSVDALARTPEGQPFDIGFERAR